MNPFLDTVRKWEIAGAILGAIAIILLCAFCSGCARPQSHKAPDRTRMTAAIVRVEKAIPVVRESHRKLSQSITAARQKHAAVIESHKAQEAQVKALGEQVVRLKGIAMREDAAEIDWDALRAELAGLDSTTGQLQTSIETTATLLRSNTIDVDRLQMESEAHGRAIEDLVKAKNEALAESTVVIEGYEAKVARLNQLELEHADARNALTKLRITSTLNKVWTWASGIGAGILGILMLTKKVGFL